ncbi:hypothetical protein F4860DRAFT_499770 [Xylaria cubensis]|nr:hypothetical protein F4860DRAFT_499770 [Xylaria cubensis]
MGEMQLQNSSSSALDALHERPNSLRRARPPDIRLVQDENAIPHRAEKTMKRDSMIGLRGIFSRSKAGKTDKDIEEPSSRTGLRPAGIRASLADFGNWPYRLHSSRSEASLISTASVDSRPVALDISSPYQSPHGNFSTSKPRLVEPLSGRAVTTTWEPPALFQVYPQAVKHATLPACNVSVESLARNSESRGSKLIQGIRIPEHVNDLNIKTRGEILKKKQRVASLRNPLEWTSKIFVLITSGYLLQYAAEGTYNRVPEKILQLTATSAAYASDLIPGRHWVLQVASATDANGNSLPDAKSRRSKLSIRDNRRVSNMLLIFENAESMDNWLAVLRKEIALRGGKRRVSETGQVEADEPASGTGARFTERNIVVEDRDQSSNVITRDFSYTQENALNDCTENDDFAMSLPHRFSAYGINNASPTASIISSDGQRLDNLRDSSSSHRFSYVSSGQRTMITSAGSSPACSPTRASFSSQREELQPLPSVPEVRLRPNAAAIVNRRQSMQALISSLDAPIEQSSRPYATSTSVLGHENEQLGAPSVPNFSVPQTVGKRFSFNASAPNGSNYLPQTLDHERSNKPTRKTPPTALMMSRPLSIVIDQPSPKSPCSPNSISMSVDSCQSTSLMSEGSSEQIDQTHRRWSAQLGGIGQTTADEYGQSMPSSEVYFATGAEKTRTFENMPRAASSLGSYGSRRRLSGASAHNDSFHRRLLSESRSPHNSFYSSAGMDEVLAHKANSLANSSCSPKRSTPSLRSRPSTDSQERPIAPRRSMPQLNDGPPLAPPPNYALPPIPQKPSHYTS